MRDSTKLLVSVDEIKNLQFCLAVQYFKCRDETAACNDLRLEIVRGIIYCFCFGGRDDHVTMFTLHLPLAVFRSKAYSLPLYIAFTILTMFSGMPQLLMILQSVARSTLSNASLLTNHT